jgi:hypothetical protein
MMMMGGLFAFTLLVACDDGADATVAITDWCDSVGVAWTVAITTTKAINKSVRHLQFCCIVMSLNFLFTTTIELLRERK